jgi:hypothetical protein
VAVRHALVLASARCICTITLQHEAMCQKQCCGLVLLSGWRLQRRRHGHMPLIDLHAAQQEALTNSGNDLATLQGGFTKCMTTEAIHTDYRYAPALRAAHRSANRVSSHITVALKAKSPQRPDAAVPSPPSTTEQYPERPSAFAYELAYKQSHSHTVPRPPRRLFWLSKN